MLALKFICLLLAIMYGYSNTARVIHGQSVSPFQMLAMGLGITGFIFLQWLM